MHEIKFIWVQGHSGDKGNERCDQLATEAMNQSDLEDDLEKWPLNNLEWGLTMKKNKATTAIGFINKKTKKTLEEQMSKEQTTCNGFMPCNVRTATLSIRQIVLIFGKGSALIAKGECLELCDESIIELKKCTQVKRGKSAN